ncbi:MAG: thiamine ABC transporter substrate binding subunit [Granulosicoccus sp.]|nr:thiamine ABC transporter substrate binding subunit [Granulosicoccus sp.]
MRLSSQIVLCLVLTGMAHWQTWAQEVEKPILTVYTTSSFVAENGVGPKAEVLFEETCDCDLQFVEVEDSTGILDRVRSEGDSSAADIILGIDNALVVEAQNTGLIAEHEVDMGKLNLPLAWDNQRFLPYDFGFFAFIYDKLRTPNPPKSFEQLLEADDSLKIVIQDPQTSTTGLGFLLWVKALYGENAAASWSKLAPKIHAVTKDWSEAYQMFLEREADLVLSYTTSPAFHMIVEKESKYQASPFKEGHGMQIEVAAILKAAKDPVLANLFMQFLAGESFQALIPTNNWMYPVLFPEEGLPAVFRNLVRPVKSLMIDAQGIADNKADWIDEFNQRLNR